MFQFLKLCSASHQFFPPAIKIFHFIKRDSKLFLLKFPSSINQFSQVKSIKYHNSQRDKKANAENEGKVVLYQHTDSGYFKKLKFFSLGNLIIWTLLGINTYDILSKNPDLLDSEVNQKWNGFGVNCQLAKKLIIVSVILVYFLVLAVLFYFLRSVKEIRLIKSTRIVEFQTFSFFPSVREFSVPLKDVSGVISRHKAKGYFPIKMRNSWFYFLVDVKGHFPNTFLFDNSVGMYRDFKKSKNDD